MEVLSALPQMTQPSISEFIAPRTFQPLIGRYVGTPQIDDNIEYLDKKLGEIDQASNNLDLLKAGINRLDIDDPVVKQELDKYNIDQYVDDPFAVHKVKQLAAQFKGELNDPTSMLGVAQMNYQAEKNMEKNIMERVKEGKITADDGRALISEYKRKYRATGGVQTPQGAAFYPQYDDPAQKVNEVAIVNDLVQNWASDTLGVENARAFRTKDGYIITDSKGRTVKSITPEEVNAAITPLLASNPELQAYYRQRGRINTFGKNENEIRAELSERYKTNDGRLQDIVNAQSREELVALSEQYSHADKVAELANLGITKTEYTSDISTADKNMKADTGYWTRWKQAQEDRKYMANLYTKSTSFKQTDPAQTAKAASKLQTNMKATRQQLDMKLANTGTTLERVLEARKKGISSDYILGTMLGGDQELANMVESYVQDERMLTVANNKLKNAAMKGGFNTGEFKTNYEEAFDSEKLKAVREVVSHTDILNAIANGQSFEEFKATLATNPKYQELSKTATSAAYVGGMAGAVMNIEDNIRSFYEDVKDDWEYAVKKGSDSSLRSYTQVEGLEGGYYDDSRKAYTDMVTEGRANLIDEQTGLAGNAEQILARVEGELNDDLTTDNKYTDIQVSLTTDTGLEGRQVFIVTGKNTETGQTVSAPVTMDGNAPYIQGKEMAARGIKYYSGNETSEMNTKNLEENYKLYANSRLKGGVDAIALNSLGNGGIGFVYGTDKKPLFKVTKTPSGFKMTTTRGEAIDGVYGTIPTVEALQAIVGKILYSIDNNIK